MLVGLISDTHGLIRPEALDALRGADLILHAGDVGGAAVLSAISTIAPVQAVYGNVDPPDGLMAAIDCTLEGVQVHVSHGHELGSPTPARLAARYSADVIVFGHTHRSLVQHVGTTLLINPGAAGPRRFNLRPSVATLSLPARVVHIVELFPAV
jgi:putative phosphoesterase